MESEDLLFFSLYSLKSGLTYDLLGLTSGLNGANAYQNQALGLCVLRAALERGGHMPKRAYQSVEEFKEHWSEESEILIDTTEQRRQRPANQKDQKEDYSGKKSPYTEAQMTILIDYHITTTLLLFTFSFVYTLQR